MYKVIMVLLLSLCTLCGAIAAQPDAKQASREQKANEKAQKKKLRQEIRHFESLRDDAVLKFAKENPPSNISTPSFYNDFRISNVICAGDNITGTVMLYFNITPLLGAFRLYMGGERNGTRAIANGISYPSSDHYGRVYTLRSGQPERIILEFYNIAPGVSRLDRVDVSMGLALNTLDIITLRNVRIFWTYSDKAISSYVKDETSKKAQ